MRPSLYLLGLSLFTAIAAGQVAEKYQGDWLLVNGVVILHIDSQGTMTLRNSGAKGSVSIHDVDTFEWSLPGHPQTGKFADGKLFLKSDQIKPPRWMQFLEFRKGDKETASEVIEFALRQQTQVANAFADVKRSSMEKTILNNLRQLAAAADQFFLEHGVDKVKFEQLVGPDKYIKQLTPIDGEDYSKLDLTLGASPWKIVSASGITVSYDR